MKSLSSLCLCGYASDKVQQSLGSLYDSTHMFRCPVSTYYKDLIIRNSTIELVLLHLIVIKRVLLLPFYIYENYM